MKSKLCAISIYALATLVGVAIPIAQAQAQNYPTKSVEVSVWSAAGGANDLVNRLIARAMEKQLGQSIVVTNRTGGNGAIAMNYIWSRSRDGYNWLGASEQMQVAGTMGFHSTLTKDWRWYMVAGAPGVLSVRADSRFKTLDDFVAAAREKPGMLNVAHCSTGCVWHAKALGLGTAAKIKLNSIPYAGSAPAMVAVLSGDGDAVLSSLAEQTEYIKSGKFRPLAMVEVMPSELPGYGRIPAVGEKYPDIVKMPARTWLGFAIPADTPKDIVAKIDTAFANSLKDPDLLDRLAKGNHTLIGAYGDESMKMLTEIERAVSWAFFDLGAAKVSPSTLGISRP
jgi:tripartite-type tricarboxylate transporter receptor subunit TctC